MANYKIEEFAAYGKKWAEDALEYYRDGWNSIGIMSWETLTENDLPEMGARRPEDQAARRAFRQTWKTGGGGAIFDVRRGGWA